MKKLTCSLIASLVLIVFAQGQEKAELTGWKELNDFHKVMSETFHPAEEGHLGPIRQRSREMVNKAIAWQKSSAPEGFDKKKVNATLVKLVKGAKELNTLVKSKAPDSEIKEKLSGLHDIFHEIMEKCQKEEHHQ